MKFSHLLLWQLCLLETSGSVKVIEISGLSSSAEYKGELNSSLMLTSVTACARFWIHAFTGRDPLLSLQDTASNKITQLRLELWPDKVRPVLADTWRFQLLPEYMMPNRWYHLCVSYGGESGAYEYLTYINGAQVNSMVSEVLKPVFGDKFIVGQSIEGDFHSMNARVTQVNVWNYALTASEIAGIANCSADKTGNYISWSAGFKLINSTFSSVPLESLCQESQHASYMWFPYLKDVDAFYICEALGTHLPIPETSEDCFNLQNLSRETWHTIGMCGFGFITPIVDTDSDGTFYRFYDKQVFSTNSSIWAEDEPNGGIYESCVLMSDVGIYDADCNIEHCAVCEFSEPHVYVLRGTCELELRNTLFLAHQNSGMGSLQFQGYGDYNMSLEEGKWLWLKGDIIVAEMDSVDPYFPMGRRSWTLTGLHPVCGQRSGSRVITLTPCTDDQFTCDNAACIPLNERCDLKYDCQDHSDETLCDLVYFPQGYRNDLPPTGSSGSPLGVALKLTLYSMGVETSKTQFYATHQLTLQWVDRRLMFRNMKRTNALNMVPQVDMQRIWTPVVGFVNTDSNEHTLLDEEATMLGLRTSEIHNWNTSSSAEEPLYLGSKNPLQLQRKYTTLFVCDFDLNLYPFDTQRCPIHLKLVAAPTNYLKFIDEEVSAEYLGPELLIEYQVGSFKKVYSNASEGEVIFEVTLGRRSGYAILTIYIPSLILLIISYVTLFFRPEIFEVRVMAALTSLLVVATLFTQASSSLPKTSYFKMVDIWLLFCIGVIFLIIICHALIDASLSKSEARDFDQSMTRLTLKFIAKKFCKNQGILQGKETKQKIDLGKRIDPVRVTVRPRLNYGQDTMTKNDNRAENPANCSTIHRSVTQKCNRSKVSDEKIHPENTNDSGKTKFSMNTKAAIEEVENFNKVDIKPYTNAEKLIFASKLIIILLVAMFNIVYWTYIYS